MKIKKVRLSQSHLQSKVNEWFLQRAELYVVQSLLPSLWNPVEHIHKSRDLDKHNDHMQGDESHAKLLEVGPLYPLGVAPYESVVLVSQVTLSNYDQLHDV